MPNSSPQDTLFANMQVIRRFIELKGTFLSLYIDKASHFTTTRHGGLHYQVAQEHDDTQIERALHELDIHLITANSPQAKGRIEVTFRLFQDRLIKEMRLANIKNYQQANRFFVSSLHLCATKYIFRNFSPQINYLIPYLFLSIDYHNY